MRVVVDTNVWVSRLLLSGSVAARALDKALGSFEVMVSESLVAELANVLSREKFDHYVSVQDRVEFLSRVPKVATVAPVLTEVEVCRNPDDNQVLALALDSGSDFIITGDRDLLVLHPWRGVKIVAPHTFLET